jgi:hypothetical protein
LNIAIFANSGFEIEPAKFVISARGLANIPHPIKGSVWRFLLWATADSADNPFEKYPLFKITLIPSKSTNSTTKFWRSSATITSAISITFDHSSPLSTNSLSNHAIASTAPRRVGTRSGGSNLGTVSNQLSVIDIDNFERQRRPETAEKQTDSKKAQEPEKVETCKGSPAWAERFPSAPRRRRGSRK